MTELVLTTLYYGLWLALFLVIALLVFSVCFLLKSAWKRGWIKKAWRGIKRVAMWLTRFLAKLLVRFINWLWTSTRRSASVWWDERKDNIKWFGKGLVGVGVLIGGTALFAHFYPNPGLSELKLYLYTLIAAAAVIWFNKWLVKKGKKKGKK